MGSKELGGSKEHPFFLFFFLFFKVDLSPH